MKFAFLGNCQLQQIGTLLKNYFQLNDPQHEVIWHQPVFSMGDENAQIVPLFHALEQADRIYVQFHEGRWGALSTDQISKYFKIRIVPTLESHVSFGQMNYFKDLDLKFNLFSVDFRMLDLYLKNIDHELVPKMYGRAAAIPSRRDALIENTRHKYKKLFDSGKVISDYSNIYLNAMQQETDPFFVHNHPTNSQLQWLMNEMLRDSGSNIQISLNNLPEILTDTIVPSLNMQLDERYRIRSTEVGIANAAKINYTYFSTFDRIALERELERSNYRTLYQCDI